MNHELVILKSQLIEIDKEINHLNNLGQDLKNSLNQALQINQETFQNTKLIEIIEKGNTIKKELSERIIPEINNSI